MRYEERKPSADLAEEIECFRLLTAPGPRPPNVLLRARDGHYSDGILAAGSTVQAERIVPDGCVELIVHLADPFSSVPGSGEEARAVQPRAFLVGEMTRPLFVAPTGDVETLGIRFRPGLASRFVAMPLDELTDRTATFEEIWGAAGRALERSLRDTPSPAQKIETAQRFLRRRRGRARATDGRVQGAVREILRHRGKIAVKDLARRCSLSARQLERRFHERVGLSPKLFCPIVRFQSVFREIAEDRTTGWARVALECGYFDQAHLIRDFRDFAGQAPAAFLAGEGELSQNFTSPERLSALFEENPGMSNSSKTPGRPAL